MNKVGTLFVISLIVIDISPNSLAELNAKSSAALEEFAQNLQHNIKAATANPCNNYFDFVCDSAIANRNILKFNLEDTFYELYNGAHLNNFEEDVQINNFLKSCKEADLSQLPASLMQFSRSGNYWPAFNPNWTESKFDINIAVSELNSYGLEAFFELDLKNKGDELFLEVSPEGVSVSKNVENILNYTTLSRDQISEIIHDCNQLKNEYRKVIKSFGEDTVLETDINTLDDIIIPEINWMRMAYLILGPVNSTSYRVIIKDVNKFKAIVSLMFSANPKWIGNYLFYLYVKKGVSILNIRRPGRHEDFCRDAPMTYFAHNVINKVFKNQNNLKKQKIFMDIIKFSANYLKNENYAFKEYTSDELSTALDNEYTDFLEEIELESSIIHSELDMSPDDFFRNRLLLKRFSNHNFKKKLENSIDYTETEVHKFFPRGPFTTLMFNNYSEFTPIIFNFFGKTFISHVISQSNKAKEILNTTSLPECLKTQLNYKTNDDGIADLLNLLRAEVLLDIFKEFSLKYPHIVKSEEMIFQKHGLTSKKALFSIFMHEYCNILACSEKKSDATYEQKRALTQLANYEDFGLEYGCPVGTPMNPVLKCDLTLRRLAPI